MLRLAKLIPRRIRYWVLIVEWVEASTGKHANKEAGRITVDDVLRLHQ